jgi:hypothetical protein
MITRSFYVFYAVSLLLFPLFAFSTTTIQLNFNNTNLNLFDSTGPATFQIDLKKDNNEDIKDVLSNTTIQFIDSGIEYFPPDGLSPDRPYKISSYQNNLSMGGRIFTDSNYYSMYIYLEESNPDLQSEYNVFVSSAPIPFVQTPQKEQLNTTDQPSTTFSPVWEIGKVKATIQSSDTQITVTIVFQEWGGGDTYYRLVRKCIGNYFGG